MTNFLGHATLNQRRPSERPPTLAALLPPGTAELPEDFPRRLDRIKAASGLSWRQFADKLGVDPRQLGRWRKGVEPTGGAMLALVEFSMVLPEGARLLFGESRQPTMRSMDRE